MVKIIKEIFGQEKGLFFFHLGIFFLLSAPSLGLIFLFISLIISILQNKQSYFKNNWNYPFLISGIIMLFIVFVRTFIFKINISGWNNYLNLIGLSNWIPFIICFYFFQPYLKNLDLRKKVIYAYLSGSIPLFISGFGQKFFNWYGPIGIFNNFIIWFQKPLFLEHEPMDGLFSNPNYAGAWLLLLLPMCIACIKEKRINISKKIFLLIFLAVIIFSIVLTQSRNAFIGSLISIPFIIEGLILKFILLFILFLIILFLISIIPFSPDPLIYVSNKLLPEIIKQTFKIESLEIMNIPRVQIWLESLQLIFKEPILGWGAASFPIIFRLNNGGDWYGHTHNLILEQAVSYGIIPTSIMFITIVIILQKSFNKIYSKDYRLKNYIFDKAWWAAMFTMFLAHMVDIPYFDSRISITFWILLAGLVSIMSEESIPTSKKYKVK